MQWGFIQHTIHQEMSRDDDKIYALGGDEGEVKRYAEQNGADLTEDDFSKDAVVHNGEKFVIMSKKAAESQGLKIHFEGTYDQCLDKIWGVDNG